MCKIEGAKASDPNVLQRQDSGINSAVIKKRESVSNENVQIEPKSKMPTPQEIKDKAEELRNEAESIRSGKLNPDKALKVGNFFKNISIACSNDPNLQYLPWKQSEFTDKNQKVEAKAVKLESKAILLDNIASELDAKITQTLSDQSPMFFDKAEQEQVKFSKKYSEINTVLNNPVLLKKLEEFSAKEFSSENINFMKEFAPGMGFPGTDGMQKSPDLAKLKAVFENFIPVSSGTQVNVSYKTRNETIKAYNELMRNPDNPVAIENFMTEMGKCGLEIGSLIKTDTFARLNKKDTSFSTADPHRSISETEEVSTEAQKWAGRVSHTQPMKLTSDVELRETLKKFCIKEQTPHNFDCFVKTLDAFGVGGVSGPNLYKLEKICDKYVSTQDENQVNIMDKTRQDAITARNAFNDDPSPETAKAFVTAMGNVLEETVDRLNDTINNRLKQAHPEVSQYLRNN